LPKKREYLVYAPLTSYQKTLYDAIVKKNLRQLLLASNDGILPSLPSCQVFSLFKNVIKGEGDQGEGGIPTENSPKGDEEPETSPPRGKRIRQKPRAAYQELSDEEYFQKVKPYALFFSSDLA